MPMKDIPGAKGIPTDNSVQVGKAQMADDDMVPAPRPPSNVITKIEPKAVVSMTIEELVSDIVLRVTKDRSSLKQAYHDLQLWLDAQPIVGRSDIVKKARTTLETARLAMEACDSQFKAMSGGML